MPATAGRVRMPANNRVHSSAALQTHGIWQSTIGYDPYAPSKDDSKNASQEKLSTAEPEGENAYANFQGLLALARVTSSNADEARGSCKKCGRVGHLSFQCRNFLSIKEGNKEKDPEVVQAAVLSGLEKIKGNGRRVVESEETEDDDDDEIETSDSEVDSEIERIIAERHGKKSGDKGKSSRKKEDSDVVDLKKRGRSKKRSSKKRESSDSEDEGGRKRRKEKRRKRGELSNEEEKRQRCKRKSRKEKRRRRSHRYSDYSDSDGSEYSGRWHSRKYRKGSSPSDSDVSDSDDTRIGRRMERSEKKSRKCRHYDE